MLVDEKQSKATEDPQKTCETALQQQIFREDAAALALPVHSVQNKSLSQIKHLKNILHL